MYQREGGRAYKANLDNTLALDDYLGNPSRAFKSIHIAGTNGKGSVSHLLAAVFQQCGYRTGLYTSPHLTDFRERIRVDGEMIAKEEVVTFVQAHRSFFQQHSLSFFEMTVGMAFDHFRRENVDIAIVEVGLGGRLDSTNIINPELAVITNIGLDHTEFLGDNLKAIAREKAGIVKPGTPALVGLKQTETRPVFTKVATEQGSPLYFAEDIKVPTLVSGLEGPYRHENTRTALAALELMRQQGWRLPLKEVKQGLQNVHGLTGLRGRWQWIGKDPDILCDTAHNTEGLERVLQKIRGMPYRSLHVVLGLVKEKPLDAVLPLFPTNARYYFCRPDIPRGMPAELLAESAAEFGLEGAVFGSVEDALNAAKSAASQDDMIFVGGSTFTVAEVV